ncbi:MAG: hypothetical protein AAFR76_04860 [Planctomycetota bacterium]
MTARPHISAALRQLRRGVNVCAAGVAIACFVQLLVFGFVHFTEVRFETLKAETPNRPVVVTASAGSTPAGLRALGDEAPRTQAEAEPDPEIVSTPIDINRVESAAGVLLNRFSQSASVIGVFAALSLAAFTLLGAIVAGGGAVPGVERAVTACTWGLVLGLLVLPWQDIFASMPFAGVFTSYGTMVHASAGSTPGITLILVFIGLPLVAMVGSLFVALNFSTGVERGIVASNAPDAVDLQMQDSVKSMGSHRQIGAVRNDFRKSVGAVEVAEPSAPEPTRPKSSKPPRRKRSTLNPAEEEDWKRPI